MALIIQAVTNENPSPISEDDILGGVLALEAIRRKIGKLNIVGDLKYALKPITAIPKKVFNDRFSDKENLRRDLSEIVKRTPKGIPKTPALTTATYLEIHIGGLIGVAAKHQLALSEQRDEARLEDVAAVLMDFFKGYSITLGAFNSALDVYPEDPDQVVLDSLSNNRDPRMAIIKLNALEPKKRAAEILNQDPTGFKLIDWQLNNMRAGLQIRSYEEKDFVMAGAELAESHYKKLYPSVTSYMPRILKTQ